MIACTIYNITTGEILRRCFVSDEKTAYLQADDSESVVFADAADELQYVDVADGKIKDKAVITPTTSISTGQVILSSLPDPCSVSVEDAVEEVAGGSITIEFDVPGVYNIEIASSPRYLDKTLEVEIP